MSRMRQNEDGGHTNGYTNGLGSKRYDLDVSSREPSADERSRSRGVGGYGGFANQYQSQRVLGPTALDRRTAQRRSQERDWSSSRSRSRVTGRFGEGNRQVEDILRHIDQQWSFMSSDSCIPVKVALQLMDQSSLGLADQYDQFQQVQKQLQNSLKAIVNEHHQGFNSSIGTFHQIQASILASQQRVRGLRQSLVEAKGNLSTARPELKAFATTSQNNDSMLQILGNIEELQTMPEKIEAQISEKRFLGAVETLQEALRLMRKPELEEIGALSDLQVYLSNQEHFVTDILIEELHNHLYLKSPYCEDRWKKFVGRTAASERMLLGTERRQLYNFLERLDMSQPMVEDTSHNPESDSFAYIRLLAESLDKMSRVDIVIDAIEQRLPVELFRVVETCYNEVEQRHPNVLRDASRQQQSTAGAWQDDQSRREVVGDMLSSLYARFESIAESHRVLHDIIVGLQRRNGIRESSQLRSFNELWKFYQSEIRSLLHDHLSTDGDLSSARRENDMNANMFRPHNRDKTRRLFKLSDTDNKSMSLATERDDLDYIFKASVPGLVPTIAQAGAQVEDSEKLSDRSATGHKLLVKPSVFNMGMLLPPSLSFLGRLREIVPPSSDIVVSTLTSFLDDFLVNVFLPQMEDTLTDQCSVAMSAPDAFQDDPKWQIRAARPIFKSAVLLSNLVTSFCKMLDTLPPDQSFTQLIIAQMRTYYNRCFDVYRSHVVKSQLDNSSTRILRRSAAIAESGDLSYLLKNLFTANEQEAESLSHEETALLLAAARGQPIQEADLITDRKVVGQLSTLYTSIRWFTANLTALRRVETKASDSTGTSLTADLQRRWNLDSAAFSDGSPSLPLTSETASDFDALVTSFTDLSSLILRTLHLELRHQILHDISRALNTTYLLGQPYNDPDPSILSLNKTILSMDEMLSYRLPSPQHSLCVTGLSYLIANALIAFASAVPAMDTHGNTRMQLNILVLQQNLKEIESGHVSLEQSARFWELWSEGPQAVVGAVRDGLDKDEARGLVRLIFSAPVEEGVAGGEARGQREMEEVMAALDSA